jgi:hypothetical protein
MNNNSDQKGVSPPEEQEISSDELLKEAKSWNFHLNYVNTKLVTYPSFWKLFYCWASHFYNDMISF